METMKKINFFSDLKLNIKWGMILMLATFVFIAKTGFSQTPELFEEKVLINNMAAPWAFTFINNNEVLFTEKQGKIYRYSISTGTMNVISGVPAVSQNGQGGLLDIALHPDLAPIILCILRMPLWRRGGKQRR
jgi:glucose/arabinose dehydrogenase